MRFLLSAIVLFSFWSGNSAVAQDFSAQMVTERIKPCDWWSYNSTVSGYVCRNNPWYIEVPTASEVQRVIDALNYKIRELEARIQVLENGGR